MLKLSTIFKQLEFVVKHIDLGRPYPPFFRGLDLIWSSHLSTWKRLPANGEALSTARLLKMASYGFDHSLLCPLSPFSCSGKVKFPAKTPLSTVEFCAKASKSSSVATTAIEDSSKHYPFWFLHTVFGCRENRRKLVIHTFVLPFLSHQTGC